jgi:hypothetical protein
MSEIAMTKNKYDLFRNAFLSTQVSRDVHLLSGFVNAWLGFGTVRKNERSAVALVMPAID